MVLHMSFLRGLSRVMVIALITVVAASVTSCTPMRNTHGNFADASMVAELQPGTLTKKQIRQKLGAPSSESLFADNVWFYIGQRTEQVAFFKPEVVAHQVVALSFDQGGLLDAYVVRGLDEYREIEPIARSTPSAGRRLNFLEQLVGNLGKFNENSDGAAGR